MVKDGQAVVYRQYLSGCADTQDQYLFSEAQAKAQKLGFWNQENPTMPWDYRRGKRSDSQQSSEASQYPLQSTTASSPTPLVSPSQRRTIDPETSTEKMCIEDKSQFSSIKTFLLGY
jgi:micrococcal nuclease